MEGTAVYRVLLVDDDPHILNANEKFLRQKGYEVFCAGTAEDALGVAATAILDAIVLDVGLPGMDSLSACRRLREVRFADRTTDFSTLEFDLLTLLAQRPNQVFSYEQLYDRVWRSPINQGIHNLQMRTARVRQKLDHLCPGLHYIETVRRKGCRFNPNPQKETALSENSP